MLSSLYENFGLRGRHQRKRPILCYLSKGDRLALAEYVRENSWLPYEWWAGPLECRQDTYARELNYKSVHWYKIADAGLGPLFLHEYRFCAQCAVDDYDRWGFSYWRRIHQFPGVDVCSIHRVGLSVANVDYENPYDNPLAFPHERLRSITTVSSVIAARLVDHPIVSLFAVIAEGLLRRHGPMNRHMAECTLRFRCREIAFSNGKTPWYLTLRDHILRQLPKQWLKAHFSGDLRTGGRSLRSNFEDARYSPIGLDSLAEHALALAVVYDNPQEALSAATRMTYGSSRQSRA